jgi:coproporphyrinogen III oxidase-like Fe-S oxidoreductase
MILTHVLRILLGRQIRPFTFEKAPGFLPDMNVPAAGLYVHIPFCRDTCPFCPYYKVKAVPGATEGFLRSLLTEIRIVSDELGIGTRRNATSLYFGGGSPAIMIDDLRTIRNAIDERFEVRGNAGIELHPRDVVPDAPEKLKDAGFDMVSLGVQSFSEKLNGNLGRGNCDAETPLRSLGAHGFAAVDVDLIFGIPGQTGDDLRDDFTKAVELGATQVSTYPFIDFSFAANREKPLGTRDKKMMLDILLETADTAGFERTSVWTFGKKGAARYSSVTRDCFLGFGPSATSLGRDAFKTNTFSVSAYNKSLGDGIVPTSLSMTFTERTRRLYWLFWNSYNGHLSDEIYRGLFGSELDSDFGFSLRAAEILGLVVRRSGGRVLTKKGSYRFHLVEQAYTHQYIDKTWHMSIGTPWPEKIVLY